MKERKLSPGSLRRLERSFERDRQRHPVDCPVTEEHVRAHESAVAEMKQVDRQKYGKKE